jgi:hypothetical protein
VLATENQRLGLALLAVLNSMTFDWILRRIAAGLHLNRFYLETTPLPSMSNEYLDLLANFAATELTRDTRFQGLPPTEREHVEPLRTTKSVIPASTVEALVAQGFGLEPENLEHVFKPDVSDRKGMWRYFASVPAARRIAEQSVQELAAA